MAADVILIDGVPRPVRNSNGRLIHPSAEGVRNFWCWFGDSCALDEKGRPLVGYHGTTVDEFDVFHRPDSIWIGPGMNDTRDVHRLFFSDSRAVARSYGRRIETVYMRITNPLILDAGGDKWGNVSPLSRASAALINGHDGIVVRNFRDSACSGGESATTFILFDPLQVKSASKNSGAFCLLSPSLRDDQPAPRPVARLR